jgi:hypothetical protein
MTLSTQPMAQDSNPKNLNLAGRDPNMGGRHRLSELNKKRLIEMPSKSLPNYSFSGADNRSLSRTNRNTNQVFGFMQNMKLKSKLTQLNRQNNEMIIR